MAFRKDANFLLKPDFYRHAIATEQPAEKATLPLHVPKSTKRDLKIRSVESGEPMHLLVLKALAAYGVRGPQDSLRDRRKRR